MEDTIENLKGRLTSRKFIITVWVHALSCVLLYTGTLPSDQWVQLNTFLVGIYAGSNAASKFGAAARRRIGGSGATDGT